jgi:hypothetical protein
VEGLRRRSIDGSACKGANETGSQEDGEDAEVLGGVGYSDMFVTCSEGVLDERAEVVWQWHVLGCCASTGDDSGGGSGYRPELRRDACEREMQCIADHENVEGYQRSAHGSS